MGLFKRKEQKRQAVLVNSADFMEMIGCGGYTSLANNPEIMSACRILADIISSMTIYLMSNTDNGDVRIKNELSKKIDIYPNKYMTRKTWMDAIVMNLLLYGKGNSIVIPETSNGLLGDLIPVDAGRVSFVENVNKTGYKVLIDGVQWDPQDLLHFVWNPNPHYMWKGIGMTTTLREVADNLKQEAETKKGFLSSKWKPSVIVKVDGLIDEFSSLEGRKKLLDDYIQTSQAGDPWLIPAEQFSIEQIRPLSLNDLALKDSVELDKRTVASIIGVPPFILGVGSFNEAEWNNFISTKVKAICKSIEQELTRKLLISNKWYWKFNIASQFSYDMQKTEKVFTNLYSHGIVTGNEVRDKLSLSPKEGLDELVILENYIPTNKIGDQKKLIEKEV